MGRGGSSVQILSECSLTSSFWYQRFLMFEIRKNARYLLDVWEPGTGRWETWPGWNCLYDSCWSMLRMWAVITLFGSRLLFSINLDGGSFKLIIIWFARRYPRLPDFVSGRVTAAPTCWVLLKFCRLIGRFAIWMSATSESTVLNLLLSSMATWSVPLSFADDYEKCYNRFVCLKS